MRASAPPRLLHVFSTFALGGPQRRFIQIANAFAGRYHHTIVAMDGRMDAAALLKPEAGFSLHSVPVRKGAGLSPRNLWMMAGTLRRLRPNLLLTYNWGAMEWLLVNRLLRMAPHLHVEDGFGPEESGGHQLPRRVWTRRLGIGGPVDVVVPSQTLRNIARETWRVAARRLHYVPNGVETRRFAAAAPMRLPFGPERPIVGTVAALRGEKNLARLLRIFAEVRDLGAALVIVGDGPERARLEVECRRMGLAEQVHFAGHSADPAPAYAAFDLFALTSDTEQMPYSVIEAMAAGLPVLASDVGDVRAMLPPEHAGDCTFAPGDEAAYATQLRALLQDAEARAAIGQANQRHARAYFDVETMLGVYDRLFTERTAGQSAH